MKVAEYRLAGTSASLALHAMGLLSLFLVSRSVAPVVEHTRQPFIVTPLIAPLPFTHRKPSAALSFTSVVVQRTLASRVTRMHVADLEPAEVQVGGFDRSTGLLAPSPGNIGGPVVVGAWNIGIAREGIGPTSGGVAPSSLFGSRDGASGSGTGSGISTWEVAHLLSAPSLAYTDEARKLHITGELVLEVRVTASGRAQFRRLIRGLGYGLDEVAIEAVRELRFRPASRNGVPLDAVTTVTLIFNLT